MNKTSTQNRTMLGKTTGLAVSAAIFAVAMASIALSHPSEAAATGTPSQPTAATTEKSAGQKLLKNTAGRPALDSAHAQLHLEAVRAMRRQHYSEAFVKFSKLADDGHVPSAQLAMAMLRNGTDVFGNGWSASEKQQAHWNQLISQGVNDRIAVLTSQGGD